MILAVAEVAANPDSAEYFAESPACPPYLIRHAKNLRANLFEKAGDKIGSSTWGSDLKNCPSEGKVQNLNTPNLLGNFFTSSFKIAAPQSPSLFLSEAQCKEVEGIHGVSLSLEERNRLVTTYYLQMYRLKQKTLQAIATIAALDVALGDAPLGTLKQCQDPRFPETHSLCQFLSKKCGTYPAAHEVGLKDLTEQTIRAIRERTELTTRAKVLALGGGSDCVLPQAKNQGACDQGADADKKYWNGFLCLARGMKTKASCEAFKGTWKAGLRNAQHRLAKSAIEEIESRYPWITEPTFKKRQSSLQPDNVRVAMIAQFKESRKDLAELLVKYRTASTCLTGGLDGADCRNVEDTLEDMGKVAGPPKPKVTAQTLKDARAYLKRAACQLGHRKSSQEQRLLQAKIALSSLAIGGLTLPGKVGEVVAILGDVAAYATTAYETVKDCTTSKSIISAGEELPPVVALRLGKPLKENFCPKPAISYAVNVQASSVSCSLAIAFAVMDIEPLLPDILKQAASTGYELKELSR